MPPVQNGLPKAGRFSSGLVEKKMYTFSHFCVILWSDAPGGQPRATQKSKILQAFSRKEGDTGPDFGKAVACLLCPSGRILKGVIKIWQKN
ncbi:MAG: hypothetical protein ACI4PO_10615 [Faecousia sp.]